MSESVRHFSVQEYHYLVEEGVLTEDDAVELLEGKITFKPADTPREAATIELGANAIRSRLTDDWRIRIKSAITTEDSEPEPDVAVVRGTARDYVARQPGPTDIGLIVEVAESSLDRDRGKRRLYARAGIAVYWIINLVEGCVEAYTQPTAGAGKPAYARTAKYNRDDEIPFVLDGRTLAAIAVGDLLP